jgi:hypothetical protein
MSGAYEKDFLHYSVSCTTPQGFAGLEKPAGIQA